MVDDVKCDPNPIDLKGLIDGPPANIDRRKDVVPSTTARLVVDCRCRLGECVIWDDRQNAILFTNILERKFHKLVLDGDTSSNDTKLQSYELPKMICAFGLLENPLTSSHESSNPGYIVAWEDGFQLYDLENGKSLGPMSKGEVVDRSGLPDRLNDGRVDPTGKRFVCGGCAANSDHPLKVYKCEYDNDDPTIKNSLAHTVILDTIGITNSICWSLDGNEMYLADSPCRTIRKFTYDQKQGTIHNEQLMHTKSTGVPDG
ncbi:MAG: L-arabinonolactonase [Bacillariaceae sp.]|jgi:L-arabinonolactonase